MDQLVCEISNLIQNNGYLVYDIEYNKKNEILTILIEKNDGTGISIDDCTFISGLVNEYLDDVNDDTVSYVDVSSPGVNRPLKTYDHFKSQINNDIEVKLYQKNSQTNSKKINGTLKEIKDTSIIIDTYEIQFSEIAKAYVLFGGEK